MKTKNGWPKGLKERLVTVGEIAEIAGVGPSAVSNWRERHGEFPLPVSRTSAGELFNLGEVRNWLEIQGKEVRLRKELRSKLAQRQLWDWSNQVRGVLPESDYLILPLQLLYLKHESNKSTVKPTAKSLWQTVVTVPPTELGSAILDSLQIATSQHPELGRALEPVYGLDKIKPEALRVLVEFVESIDLDESQAVGQTVSDLLEAAGRRTRKSTTFFTPSGVRDLMIEILSPIRGDVYDPAFGTAQFLAGAWRSRQSGDVLLYGQEVNESLWRIAALHLALNDADFDLAAPADTLLRDAHPELRADRIALDPPFGSRPQGMPLLEGDDRWEFGPPDKSGHLAWIQHVVWHLKPTGQAVMLCPSGVLSRKGREAEIRGSLLEADVLDAVVHLPEGVLPATSLPPVLLVFDKTKEKRERRVLFVDARKLGRAERGGIHDLRPGDIEEVKSVIHAWRDGDFTAEPSFSAQATVAQVEGKGWDLSVQNYVKYLEIPKEVEGEPIPDRFSRLSKKVATEYKSTSSSLEGLAEKMAAISGASKELNWTFYSLKELLLEEPLTGVGQADNKAGQPIPFIDTGLVRRESPVLATAPADTTTVDPKERLVNRGDLLVVSRGVDRDGPIGCAKIDFGEPATYSKSLVRLRVNPKLVLPDFLRLFLTSRQGLMSLRAVATGTVITNLPKAALQGVQVPVPDLPTQRRIVKAVQGLERAMADVSELEELLSQQHDVIREGLIGGTLVVEE